MHLTNFTDYGLRCLMYLAAHQYKLSTVKEISEYFGISRNHLVKVVHKLSQLKLIVSAKGKGGGIRLACDAESTKVGDVIKLLEANMNLVECYHDSSKCKITNICLLKHCLHEASQAFVDALNKYSLADIANTFKKDPLISFNLISFPSV